MNGGREQVLERNMGIMKEMLMTLPHFQGCTRELERENEQLRERSAILMRENRIQLEKIGTLEQSSMNLKQENEILRIKLAQNEALINKLRVNEGSEEAMKQLVNEAKSYKAKAAETDRSRRELKRVKMLNTKITYILKERLNLSCVNEVIEYVYNFGFKSAQNEEPSSEESEDDVSDYDEPPVPKKVKPGMVSIQNYIKMSISEKDPEEIAEYVTSNEARIRDITIALSVLLTDKIVPPSVVEMELDVVFSSRDTVTMQSSSDTALIEVIRAIASNESYATLPELIMSDLAGRLLSAVPQDDRIATYAHSLASLCRSMNRPDIVRTACYELLLHYSSRGLGPYVIAALLSPWPAPFAGLSSFPLPGAWVLAAMAAVTGDVLNRESAAQRQLWEKIRRACVWDTDTSMNAVAELLVANETAERALSDDDIAEECKEQWVLCAELMKSHFGGDEWIRTLKDAEANRTVAAPCTSSLLRDYIELS